MDWKSGLFDERHVTHKKSGTLACPIIDSYQKLLTFASKISPEG